MESSFSAMFCGDWGIELMCVVDLRGGSGGEVVDVGVVFVAASGSLGGARRDDDVWRKLLGGGACTTDRSTLHGTSYPSNVRFRI